MSKTSRIHQFFIVLLINFKDSLGSYDKYYLDDSNFCRKTTNSVPIGQQSYKSTIIISAVQTSNSYRPSLKCSLVVRAPQSFGIIINKRMINLRNESFVETSSSKRRKAQHNHQPKDQLILSFDNQIKSLIGSDFEEEFYSSGKNEVLITFLTSSSKSSTFDKNFELILTAFQMTDTSGQCSDQNDWFNCGDNRCVQKSLICDNVINCLSNKDEDENLCGKWCSKNRQLFWTLFVVGWAISTVFIALTIIICLLYRRLCFIICF